MLELAGLEFRQVDRRPPLDCQGDHVVERKGHPRLEQRVAEQRPAIGAGGGGERQAGAVAQDEPAERALRLQRRAQLGVEGDGGHLRALDSQFLAVDFEAKCAVVEAGQHALDGVAVAEQDPVVGACLGSEAAKQTLRLGAVGRGQPEDRQRRKRQRERLLTHTEVQALAVEVADGARQSVAVGEDDVLAVRPGGQRGAVAAQGHHVGALGAGVAEADGPARPQLAQGAFQRLAGGGIEGKGGGAGSAARAVAAARRTISLAAALGAARRSPPRGRPLNGKRRDGRASSSLLQDRQVVVGHLEDDAGHCGTVLGAEQVGPGAVVDLIADQFVADLRVPAVPVLAAGGPHGLDGVIMAVEVVHVGLGADAHRAVADEVVQAGRDLLPVVDAGAVQGGDAGRGAGEAAALAGEGEARVRRLVDEGAVAAAALPALLDVLDAALGDRGGDVGAGVLGRRRAIIWQTVTEMSASNGRGL